MTRRSPKTLFLSLSLLVISVSVRPLLCGEPASPAGPPSPVEYRDTHGPFLRQDAYALWRSIGLMRERVCAKAVAASPGVDSGPLPNVIGAYTCPGGSNVDCTAGDFCNDQEIAQVTTFCVPPTECRQTECQLAPPGYSCCYCAVVSGPCAGCSRDKTCN